MAEVINLRRVRKARAKSQKEEQAAQNRLLFGASKLEKATTAAAREKDKRLLDGHQLSPIQLISDTSDNGDPS
ncbi:DUF4169 family protein [Pseudochelatococcus sp. G4_1912]|uniref:DUF4169 family protein n=1 Tax=Pseudochelatococcus sp. G4_1912 TaxID=3114288 RepID=UPI0039C5D112